ncbi:MAG: glycosyltransferase family 4 protein [Myxococcales bacterium]|nr:glycosyltransferase family 4 protein [Myxococcales bacterium]
MRSKPSHATVYINGRFLSQQLTGVQRYAREVVTSLDRLIHHESDFGHVSFVLLTPRNAAKLSLTNIEVREVGWGSGHSWEQLILPVCARSGVLLGLTATGPLSHSRQMVTIHDASVYAVPDAFGSAFRAWYRLLIPTMLRRNALTMTVSEFSAQELIRYTGVSRSKIRVSGAGWQHIQSIDSDPSFLARNDLQNRRYLLAVGSSSPHKNFSIIGEALDLLEQQGRLGDISLVVAGGTAPHIFAPPSTHQRIQHVGYVTNESLRALYENAAAFIFPSRYEGFGLPPLEAMSVGCPVICARAASLPEVCQDAPLYFDPCNAVELAEAMIQLTQDHELASKHRARGNSVLSHHSWDFAAQQHLGALSKLLQLSASSHVNYPSTADIH